VRFMSGRGSGGRYVRVGKEEVEEGEEVEEKRGGEEKSEIF
jgi:hypothetical protein